MASDPTHSLCVDLQQLQFKWANGPDVLSIGRFTIRNGERIFLKGPSGSGKSTLLGVIAGVFSPSAGKASVLNHEFQQMSAAMRDRVRADAMGVIFQQFNLVPYLTLIENVLLPCYFSAARAERLGATAAERQQKAHALLERFGLDGEALGTLQHICVLYSRASHAERVIGWPEAGCDIKVRTILNWRKG